MEIERLHGVIGDLADIFINYSNRAQGEVRNNDHLNQDLARLTAQFVSKAQEASTGGHPGCAEPTSKRENTRDANDQVQVGVNKLPSHASVEPSIELAWSPRLNYGAFLAFPDMQPDRSGLSLELEIRAGRDSFAARLFYETVKFARRELKRMVGPPPVHPSEMYRFTRHFEPLELTVRRTLECFERLHGGVYSCDEDADFTEKMSMANTANQIQDYLGGINDGTEDYFDIYDTERYLQHTWSVQLTSSKIKRKAMSEGFDGRLKFADTFVEDTGLLASRIATAAICFGNGPRFAKSFLDSCMRRILHSG